MQSCEAFRMTDTVPTWDLADRLRKSMRTAGLSVQEIAAELEISPGSVSGWINGRHVPSRQALQLWALRTGVNYEWLRDGKPQVEGGIIAVYCPPGIAA
jgi:transcriptional regulator with XRE-family HTH domain